MSIAYMLYGVKVSDEDKPKIQLAISHYNSALKVHALIAQEDSRIFEEFDRQAIMRGLATEVPEDFDFDNYDPDIDDTIYIPPHTLALYQKTFECPRGVLTQISSKVCYSDGVADVGIVAGDILFGLSPNDLELYLEDAIKFRDAVKKHQHECHVFLWSTDD